MAWGPKPKLLVRVDKSATINGKKINFTVTRTSVKRPERSPYGGTIKGKWKEYVSTTGKIDIFPDAAWWPEVDFGDRICPCSCEGWEHDAPEFEACDEIISAMIFEVKGWEQEETADQVIARLSDKN